MNTVNCMIKLRYSKFIVILISAILFSIMLTGAVNPVLADCPVDMVSYWKFEEVSGNSYDDHNGSNDAQCSGTCPAYTLSGMINAGQIFNGNNTGLSVPADSSFDWGADDSFSIEYWMKRSPGVLAEDEVIIGRRDSSGNLLWWSGLLSDGRPFFILTATNGDGGESSEFLYGTGSLADGLWHHIVAIRDAADNKNVLFVDGEEKSAVSVQYSAGFDSSTANLNIGWLNLDSGYHFNGALDEVAIYNKVLSDIEISQHYNDGLVGLRLGYCEDGYPVNIMPLGDSLTYGYLPGTPSSYTTGYRQKLYLDLFDLNFNIDFVGSREHGGDAVPSFNTYHEGHSAWTDYDIVDGNPDYPGDGKLDVWLPAYNPEVILLHIGTNELDTSPDDVENILNEIDTFSEDIPVILARIINRATYSSETTIFNDNVEDMANIRIANGDRIILVDQESALTYPDDMSDNLHPAADGYDKMANVWLDGLVKILPLSGLNSEPVIFSIPKTVTLRNSHYIYDVNAIGSPLPTYTLTSAPTGMTIDGSTGVIEWLHPSTGDYNITVMAENSEGSDLQEFTINVLADFDQIIDNDSPYFVTNGNWYESTTVEGYYGDNYLWTYGGGSGEATGEWMFEIPSNGQYKVFAWWPGSHGTRSPDTRYTIQHDNELTTVVMDQTVSGGQWNELGAFYFLEGRASVFIDNNATDDNPVADAIRIKSVPKAGFIGTPTTGSVPLSISFSDSSTGIINTWTWNFGDGGTSSLQNPTHEYTAIGDYTVSLTVIGPDGTDTLTIENYIKVLPPSPVAGFFGDPTSGTESLPATFTDESTGEIDTWSWDFGDGSTSNTQNPNHVYTSPGVYSVSLKVTGPGGTDTRTIEDYISVLAAPPSGTPAGADDGGGGGCFIVSSTGL